MAAAGEHGAWCQDMCPCVPFENRSVAPPQGFWDNRYLRQRLRSLQGAAGVPPAPAAEEVEAEEQEWSVEQHFNVSKRRELL